jgi:hypothetical protein
MLVYSEQFIIQYARCDHKSNGSKAFMGNVVRSRGGRISEGCILIATLDLMLNAPFACT